MKDINGDGRDDLVVTPAVGDEFYIMSSDSGFQVEEPPNDPVGEDLSGQVKVVPGATEITTDVTQMGAAVVSMPITLPKGTGGLTPELSLDYSSSGSNGMMGMGWALSGQSLIQRCDETKAWDGNNRTVQYNSQDKLCLDEQRLVLVSGTHLAAGSEYRLRGDAGTKIKITSASAKGPKTIEVWRSSGEIFRYGGGDLASAKVLDTTGAYFEWHVSRVTDRSGNYFDYNYYNENGEFYLEQVAYSGNSNAGIAPSHKVDFKYIQRSDPTYGYIRDNLQSRRKLLSKIDVRHAGKSVRSYNLQYEQTSVIKVPKLIKVQECAVNNTCFNPTEISWHDSGQSYSNAMSKDTSHDLSQFTNGKGWDNEKHGRELVDLDGDGVPEIAGFKKDGLHIGFKASNGSYSIEKPAWNIDGFKRFADEEMWNSNKLYVLRRQFIDLNDDGFSDILSQYYYLDASNTPYMVIFIAYNQGGSFSAPKRIADVGNGKGLFLPGDINNDGRTDLVKVQHLDGEYGNISNPEHYGLGITAFLQKDDGTFEATVKSTDWLTYGFPVYLHWSMSKTEFKDLNENPVYLSDFNEDGTLDLVVLANGKISVAYGDGFAFGNYDVTSMGGTITPNRNHAVSNVTQRQIIDVNADGLDDFVGFKTDGVYVALNQGSKFASMTRWTDKFGNADWDKKKDLRLFVDVNGDGFVDIIGTDTSGVEGALGNGRGFTPLPGKLYDGSLAGWSNEDHSRIFADVDGDNFVDFVALGDNAFVATSNYKPTKVSEIKNGLGATTHLEYSSLMDPSIYQQDSVPVNSPLFSYRGPLYVVKTVKESDGRKNFNERQYSYSGMKIHKRGLGNLGFRQQVIRDLATNTTVTKTFSQDHLELTHTLPVSEVTLRDKDGVAQRVTKTVDWEKAVLKGSLGQSNFRYRTDKVAESVVTEIRESGQSTFNEVTSNTTEYQDYDLFGQARKIITTVEDEFGTSTKVTNNTISHDQNRWILNRLTSSSVDSSFTPKGSPHGQHLASQTGRRTSEFAYDPFTGYLRSETSEPDSQVWSKTSYEYDVFGQQISETNTWPAGQNGGLNFSEVVGYQEFDPTGRYVVRSYTTLNDSQTSFASAIHKSEKTYDMATGLPTSITDANGNTKLLEYDEFGRPTRTQLSDGTWTERSTTFCGSDCPEFAAYKTVSTASDGGLAITYFDRFNRVVEKRSQTLNGLITATATQYDNEGKVTHVSEPYFVDSGPQHWIESHYDGLGRLVRVDSDFIPPGTDSPVTVSKHIAYDGLKTTTTNEKGQTKVSWEDSQGLTIKVVDDEQNALFHAYDVYGNLISTKDAYGNETLITYDRRGNKTSVDDPDKGLWTYRYNGIGKLYQQADAKGQIVEFEYDRLGRKTKRIDNAQLAESHTDWKQTTWEYDTSHVGKLDFVDDGYYRESHDYDSFGRLLEKVTVVGDEEFTSNFEYDEQGRVQTEYLPEGFSVDYHYNNYGFLQSIGNNQTNTTYWEAQLMDEHGNLVQYDLNAGAYRINRIHESARGVLRRSETTTIAGQKLQDQTFEYDVLSNLTGRKDAIDRVQEEFSYDRLNRLIESETYNDQGDGYGLIKSVQVAYDALGNILSKSDVGSYSTYGGTCDGVSAGPHAVTSITGEKAANYCYDQNGNMVSGAGRSMEYTSFDKPSRIVKGDNEVRFNYGPERNRIQRVDSTPDGSTTTTYLGSYERVRSGSTTQHKYYVGGSVIVTKQTGKSDQIHYLLKDHLDSVNTIVDDDGNVVERRHFDSWGNRLGVNWNSWDDNADWYGTKTVTTRGFTGHEHIASVGLVHMNGRVYDPTIGRFIQADPIVQAPNDLQSLNRYSYVRNNPLSLIDPSGYSWLSKTWSKIKSFVKKWWRPIVSIAIIAFAPQFAPAFLGKFGAYAAAGFAAGYVSTGTLKGALVGGISAGLFYGIGQAFVGAEMTFGNAMTKVWAHGMAGAAQSAALGGEAHAGFVTAGFTQAFSAFGGFKAVGATENGSHLWNASAAAAVGGTAAKLAGGKFANGAVTGAFSRMFNDVAHAQNGSVGATGSSSGRNPLSVVGDMLGKVWNIPNTILGLTFGGVGHVAGLMMGTNPSITFGNNAIQFHNNPFMPTAITLGNVIVYGPRTSPSDHNVHFQNTPSGHTVGQEEYRHTIQGQILGPLYLPAHIIGGVSSMFRSPNAGLLHPVDSWHSNNFMETGPMQDRVF